MKRDFRLRKSRRGTQSSNDGFEAGLTLLIHRKTALLWEDCD